MDICTLLATVRRAFKDPKVWQNIFKNYDNSKPPGTHCYMRKYSWYHLQKISVPKPGDQRRFCPDRRYLNACTDMEGRVIPIIAETLQRIGSNYVLSD